MQNLEHVVKKILQLTFYRFIVNYSFRPNETTVYWNQRCVTKYFKNFKLLYFYIITARIFYQLYY